MCHHLWPPDVLRARLADLIRLVAVSWVGIFMLGCAPATTSSVLDTSTQTVTKEVAPPEKKTAEKATTAVVKDDSWAVIYLQGKKIGFGHTLCKEEQSPDGKLLATLWQSEQVMRVQRFGQLNEQTIRMGSVLGGQGELISLTAAMLGGQGELTSQGEVRGGILTLENVAAGRKSKFAMPCPTTQQGFFGVEHSLMAQPMQAGEKRTIEWLMPLNQEVIHDDLEALQIEEVQLLDERRSLLKVHSRAKLGGQTLETFYWTDPQGRIWLSSNPGLQQEIYRTTREVAEQPATETFDLGRATIVKINRDLGDHVNLERVVYLASVNRGDINTDLFATGLSQQVAFADDTHKRLRVTVRKVTSTTPATDEKLVHPPTDGDRQPNTLIQSDDSLVKQLARDAAPPSDDPWATAQALEKFVNRELHLKNFSQAFASAAEVAKSREGDCTEHAVLLAALCRARGIPARVAAGLVYYAPEHGFAYHMWNEVWVNDRWVPLDATLARGGIGGGHLKLFDSNLEGAGPFSAFLPVLNVLGRLELEVETAE